MSIYELQKVKEDMDKKHSALVGQLRAEFSKFTSETTGILNTIDERIAERVQEEVRNAFSEIKTMIQNLKLRGV